MRWLVASLLLFGCPREAVVTIVDAGVVVQAVDAGPLVTEASLAAWLEWQKALATLPVADGGVALRQRARAELQLLSDAGLSVEQADALEAVISAVVTERAVARLSGADALAQFQAGLAQLSPEQRAKAEKAFLEMQAKAPPHQASLAPLEAEFGAEAVRVVLTREAEVAKAWDALLEAKKK